MSAFAEAWAAFEKPGPHPERIRNLRVIQWEALREAAERAEDWFVSHLVRSLHAGDAWIVRGVFPGWWMRDLKNATAAWCAARPSAFHKMLEGTPDFHRVIDLEVGKNYSIKACKHSAYFYRWNDDPLGIWPVITERWRVAKVVMGLRPDEYEENTPKDGVVDRIQVVRYPPSIGFLEPHVDAWQHQRLFFSAYMSKRGVDYRGGGFYFVDAGGKIMEVEDMVDVGDVCLGHANLLHGVAPADRGTPADWGKDDGRWFLSMYSNASDEVPARHTAKPINISVPPEVLP